MDILWHHFAISGVETWLWLPPLAGFVVSFFSAMVGISGAFLLLPLQMSVLGFTSPAVSATNLVFNLVATPAGVYRYLREGRLVWPLVGLIAAGTLPGIGIGYWLRVHALRDIGAFQVFVALVLLYLVYRLLSELRREQAGAPGTLGAQVSLTTFSPRRTELAFGEASYGFDTRAMLALAAAVGVIGGVYGIGGGAIIAPFCVSAFRLPVYVVAGAALAGTLFTSVAGIAFYLLVPAPAGVPVAPDWPLGLLFGAGGFAGMYLGARAQKHVPQRVLKGGLAGLLLVLALGYLV